MERKQEIWENNVWLASCLVSQCAKSCWIILCRNQSLSAIIYDTEIYLHNNFKQIVYHPKDVHFSRRCDPTTPIWSRSWSNSNENVAPHSPKFHNWSQSTRLVLLPYPYHPFLVTRLIPLPRTQCISRLIRPVKNSVGERQTERKKTKIKKDERKKNSKIQTKERHIKKNRK